MPLALPLFLSVAEPAGADSMTAYVSGLRVLVVSPNGGELWWGYRTIQWSGACDPPDNVTYRIEISVDGGSSWGYVDEKSFWEENIPALHEVVFNTTGIENSTKCLVRVSAKAQTWGFENSDTSDNFFTIQNVLPPPPLTPTVLSLSPQSFSMNPGETRIFTATLLDNSGNPVRDKVITWSATAGYFSMTTSVTNSLGQAWTVYVAPDVATETSVVITVSFAGDEQYLSDRTSATGEISPLQVPPAWTPTSLTLSPDIFTIESGSTISLVAVLLDSSFNPLAGKTITWTATAGEVSPATTSTNAQGKVTVLYTAPVVDIRTAVMVIATFWGDNQYRASQAVSKGLVVLPEVAKSIENLTGSLQDLKFSVDNLAQEISKVAGAISEGRVAASVTVKVEVETGRVKVKKDFQHEQVQAQVEVRGNNVIARISSENREGRTVILNVDNRVLPIVNIRHVRVEVDGQEIPLADDYDDVLDPTNDGGWAEYLILVGGEGIQVLVSLPHFSTRTITIRGPITGGPSYWTPALVAVSIVVIVLILLLTLRRKPVPR